MIHRCCWRGQLEKKTRIWKVLIWKVRDEIGKHNLSWKLFDYFGKNQFSWKVTIEVGKINIYYLR